MSAAEILKRLDQAATPGPWHPGPYEIFSESADCPIIGDGIRPDHADQEFIATVRNALPALADVVEAADELFHDAAWHGHESRAVEAVEAALARLEAQLGEAR